MLKWYGDVQMHTQSRQLERGWAIRTEVRAWGGVARVLF